MRLKRRLSQPGIVVSALAHVGVLAATLIAFSQTEKFDDQQETVPIEVVTDNQFNQIMKGDKSAKQVRPDATAATEQQAQPEVKPVPPTPEHTTPPPPPPPPPTPAQRQADHQPAPTPVTPPPPPPVPTPPVRVAEAEAVIPKPPPKPKPPPPVPTPPVVPHPVVAKTPPKPKPVEKPKVDQLAKLMDEQPPEPDTPPPPKPTVSHAKPAHDTSQDSKFDLTDISKLLSHEAPAQPPASTRQLGRLASLGSPTASAPKMSPSFWAGLDGLLEDQYRGCWSYLGLAAGSKYIPQVRVVYGPDGSLEGQPVLINPPSSDPEMQNLAESAMRAVRRCNPLKIPEQYAPYYEQWKGRVLRFDPEEMAG